MERAALLVQGADSSRTLIVIDTSGTPAGAAAAAAAAVRARAALILGPLFAAEVRPVLTEIGGRVPVLAFSNDAMLRESGAFLLGITPAQSVGAILRYARGRGVRRIAMAPGAESWRTQAAAAAREAAAGLGLAIAADADPATIAALPDAARPDAILITSRADLTLAATTLRGSGIQLLGAFQGIDYDETALTALEGAWFSAPDPAGFEPFARAFEARNGSVPGAIAGLAYDAAGIAAALRRSGAIDRSGLVAPGGFKGVCGNVRFRDDGSAARALAILEVRAGAYRVVDRGGLG